VQQDQRCNADFFAQTAGSELFVFLNENDLSSPYICNLYREHLVLHKEFITQKLTRGLYTFTA